ncbi:MAG: pseudouridine synthase [Thiobacillaceae bacterium]
MARLILFNKPYGILSQFTAEGRFEGLSGFGFPAGVYAAGRLDADSEGLLILTDDGALQHQIAHPKAKLPKTYWAQVEGVPDEVALAALRSGVDLKDFVTLPAEASLMNEPALWPRNPPIRFRRDSPTSWLAITIREGKNRQVRRMTASVGHPTLRLVRVCIGNWHLNNLQPGDWQQLEINA